VHRQLASGLSMPVGFKNGTDGNIQVAIDGVKAAAAAHHFFGTDNVGRAAVVETVGNPDCHVILRGGTAGPNYDTASVATAIERLSTAGLSARLMIDCSHANSAKDHLRQAEVTTEVAARIKAGEPGIAGLMLESFLVAGAQSPGPELTYGQSVTDQCMDFQTTAGLVADLYAAMG
jgi:3-deoxy-7-phosphoheptulonate synthase